jgi:hypothetical protein
MLRECLLCDHHIQHFSHHFTTLIISSLLHFVRAARIRHHPPNPQTFAEKGAEFLKHGRHGQPHMRHVFLDVVRGELNYTSGAIAIAVHCTRFCMYLRFIIVLNTFVLSQILLVQVACIFECEIRPITYHRVFKFACNILLNVFSYSRLSSSNTFPFLTLRIFSRSSPARPPRFFAALMRTPRRRRSVCQVPFGCVHNSDRVQSETIGPSAVQPNFLVFPKQLCVHKGFLVSPPLLFCDHHP